MNITTWRKAGLLGGFLMVWMNFAAANPFPGTSMVVFPLDIKFETNLAVIKTDQRNENEFKKLTGELNNYPYAKVEIEGYADATGPQDFNQKLSEERAEAVRQRFIDRYGIAGDRIVAKGFGETKPAAPNDTKTGRAENRRVIARIFRLEPNQAASDTNHL